MDLQLKPLPGDYPGVRHGFGAEASLTLTQRAPEIYKNDIKFCCENVRSMQMLRLLDLENEAASASTDSPTILHLFAYKYYLFNPCAI